MPKAVIIVQIMPLLIFISRTWSLSGASQAAKNTRAAQWRAGSGVGTVKPSFWEAGAMPLKFSSEISRFFSKMDGLKEINLLSAAWGGSGSCGAPALRPQLGPEQERPDDHSREGVFISYTSYLYVKKKPTCIYVAP